MNRDMPGWMLGGVGFLLAAVLFAMLVLSRAGGPAGPTAAPRAALPERSPMADRLPVPEELGIVLPAEEPAPPASRPQAVEQEPPAEKPGHEDTIREIERQGILTY